MMKKLIISLMVCTAMFTTLGCSNNSSKSSSNEKTKVFVTVSAVDEFKQNIIEGMKSSAQKNNMDLDIEEANNNVENQIEQVKEAKNNGYDVIVCLLVDIDTAQQVTNIAGDTPVIFINNEPDEDKLKSDKDIYVASNEKEVVNKTIDYLKQHFNENKSFNAVILEGDRSNKATSIRTDLLKNTLKKEGYDINYVFQDSANWNEEQAKEMFKAFLKLEKKYDVVICNNDRMALGVIKAMEDEGIDPAKTPILGVDALEDACKAIIDGKMAFTIKQSGEGQGESVINAAKVLKEGGKINKIEYADENGKCIWYPYSNVDKSNASEYLK